MAREGTKHSRWALIPEDIWGFFIFNPFPSVATNVPVTGAVFPSDGVGVQDTFVVKLFKILTDEIGVHDVADVETVETWTLSLSDEVGVSEISCEGHWFFESGIWSNHKYYNLFHTATWEDISRPSSEWNIGKHFWFTTGWFQQPWFWWRHIHWWNSATQGTSGNWNKITQSTGGWTKIR